MRILIFFILGFLFASGFLSCRNSESDYELQVLNEIFIELTGNMYVSNAYPLPPPPPILDENDNIIGYDTVTHNDLMTKYRNELKNLKIDRQTVVIAINDSLFAYRENDLEYIQKQFTTDKYLEAFLSIKNEQKIVLE